MNAQILGHFHYNEEEISRHLEKGIGYWPVQINGNKFATGEILKKPVEVVKGQILSGWAEKSPELCSGGKAFVSNTLWMTIMLLASLKVPNSYTEASKFVRWSEAMEKEMELIKNCT